MVWPTVTLSDLTDRWPLPATVSDAVAAKRLQDAEAELRNELREHGVHGTPTFDTTEQTTDWENLYVATVVAAVKRELSNPDGLLETREQIDDYSRTERRDSAVSTGLLYFSDAEVGKLVPRARRRRGSFTIRLGAT